MIADNIKSFLAVSSQHMHQAEAEIKEEKANFDFTHYDFIATYFLYIF